VSRVPAKEMERKRDEPTGRDLVFVLPTNQTCDGREVCCFTPSPSAAISISTLRSRIRALLAREITTADKWRTLTSTQDPQEARMRDRFQYRCSSAANRCAICEGRFGLIRHYTWRTALCSRKCADRFKVRREDDRRFLPRNHAA
jgi:hypothetical protein